MLSIGIRLTNRRLHAVRGSWMDGHKLYIALRLMRSGSVACVNGVNSVDVHLIRMQRYDAL